MGYLNFSKKDLINLEYSLNREVLRTNRAGSYSSSTLVGCNTRKYHGLLVCPMEHLDDDKHVLLSSLDVSIIQEDTEFNLGIHKYQGDNYVPRGHKYIQEFKADVFPKLVYRVGSVRLLCESLLVEKEQQILIQYTVLDAEKPLKLKFTPFLAFRNVHSLSKANMHVNSKVKHIPNGIKMRLYDGYAWLHMQFSRKAEFIHVPDWYYNIEYSAEQERGYEYQEDLFVPGFFEMSLKKGDSVIFSGSTELVSTNSFKRKFSAETSKRIPREDFRNSLLNSAEQFIVRIGKRTEVVTGYHWYATRTRDALIALPGLSLSTGNPKAFFPVIDTIVSKLKNGLLPDILTNDELSYNSADTPLWLFWAMQQYSSEYGNHKRIWNNYGKYFRAILQAYKKGKPVNIKILPNGLLHTGTTGTALTWMDSVVNGKPVSPRIGCVVEINALWYNAISYAMELAKEAGDSGFIRAWKDEVERLGKMIVDTFWDDHQGYLADFIEGELKDWSIRPNQVIAIAMPYTPFSQDMRAKVIESARRYLLTPRGLRSLSPRHPDYIGTYFGDQDQRSTMSHQGTVWPWLLEHYCEAYVRVYKKSALAHLKQIIEEFSSVVNEHGIDSVSELYEGDPPHQPKGTISQAWSVAALLRVMDKIEELELE